MPHLGVSVFEGTVITWHKMPGEPVTAGEAICDVATDKIDTEIESPGDGTLAEHVAKEGETVAVGETIGLITTAGDPPVETRDSVPAAVAPSPPPPQETAAAPERMSDGRPRANSAVPPGPYDHAAAARAVVATLGRHRRAPYSPLTRRLAAANNIDLSRVVGSGLSGRVTRADVENALATRTAAPAVAATTGATEPTRSQPPLIPVGYEDVPHEIVATSFIRKATAEHMIRSRQTAAHMTTEVDVDLTLLTAARTALNEERASRGEERLSFLSFLARSACASLPSFPNINSTFDRERYVRWGQINLGIAVDTPQGLMVPVVRDCGDLTVEAIARRIVDVAERARAKKLTTADLRAGTFTISNPGSVGAVSAPAIINLPQVAILGVPIIVRRPWVVRMSDGEETIAIRPILRLALTFDHRAIDGAEATRFLVRTKENLENWRLQDYR